MDCRRPEDVYIILEGGMRLNIIKLGHLTNLAKKVCFWRSFVGRGAKYHRYRLMLSFGE